MTNNFDACLALTLRYEGGFVNDPRDPGGATNMGITIATLSRELGRKATVAEVADLSRTAQGRACVAAIYRKAYWNPIDGDALPAGVDALLFDIAVNSGPGRALKWAAQTAHLQPHARIAALDALRRGFWKRLTIFRRFGRGWFAREDDLRAQSLRMVQARPPASLVVPR